MFIKKRIEELEDDNDNSQCKIEYIKALNKINYKTTKESRRLTNKNTFKTYKQSQIYSDILLKNKTLNYKRFKSREEEKISYSNICNNENSLTKNKILINILKKLRTYLLYSDNIQKVLIFL